MAREEDRLTIRRVSDDRSSHRPDALGERHRTDTRGAGCRQETGGSAIDEIFWKWEPARKILDPLTRAWWTYGERCPDDLAAIIRETRELWKLVVVQADQAELEAQVAELDRLTSAGFERRRAET